MRLRMKCFSMTEPFVEQFVARWNAENVAEERPFRAAFKRQGRSRSLGPLSTVLAVEQILHRLATGRIRALVAFPSIGRFRTRVRIFFTAGWTPIRKSRLSRLQLKLLPTNRTLLDRKSH